MNKPSFNALLQSSRFRFFLILALLSLLAGLLLQLGVLHRFFRLPGDTKRVVFGPWLMEWSRLSVLSFFVLFGLRAIVGGGFNLGRDLFRLARRIGRRLGALRSRS